MSTQNLIFKKKDRLNVSSKTKRGGGDKGEKHSNSLSVLALGLTLWERVHRVLFYPIIDRIFTRYRYTYKCIYSGDFHYTFVWYRVIQVHPSDRILHILSAITHELWFSREKFHLFSSHLINQSDKLHWMSVTDVFLQLMQTSLPYVLFPIIIREL